jgi:predicted amidohydrolase YtcJ
MTRIYRNARITTLDDEGSEAEALVVQGDRIVYVGSASGAEAAVAGEAAERIDLAGRRVLPGFIDAHAHLSFFGAEQKNLALKPLPTLAAILDAVRADAQVKPPGSWIRGFGYNHLTLPERRHPTRHDLDRVAPRHPVVLTRTCGHIAAVNSEALRRAGIPLDASDPSGGRYDRDPDGRLNGVLYDQALGPVQQASAPSDEELLDWIEEGSRIWAAAGIVAVHDAGGPPGYFRVLARAAREGRLCQRLDAMVLNGLGIQQLDAFLPSGLATGFHVGDLYVGAAKVMVDGSSSGPTAATREPYVSDPGSFGILYHDAASLQRILAHAAANGFQLTAHAVGDRAVALAATAIGAVGDRGRRNRIEHCAMCPPDLVALLTAHDITPVAQPAFLYEFGDGYLESYGSDRGARLFPLRRWLDAGLFPAGSSDSPVSDYRPLSGIAAAMSRVTRHGAALAPEERLTLGEALRLYTVNAARLTFSEHQWGRLRAGFLANLVVLEEDVFRMTDPADIRSCPIALTVYRGRTTWSAMR